MRCSYRTTLAALVLAPAAEPGAPVVDVRLPPGAYDATVRQGWRAGPTGTAFVFRSRAGVGGVTKAIIRGNAVIPRALKVVVKGKSGTYPVVDITVSADGVEVVQATRKTEHWTPEATTPLAEMGIYEVTVFPCETVLTPGQAQAANRLVTESHAASSRRSPPRCCMSGSSIVWTGRSPRT